MEERGNMEVRPYPETEAHTIGETVTFLEAQFDALIERDRADGRNPFTGIFAPGSRLEQLYRALKVRDEQPLDTEP